MKLIGFLLICAWVCIYSSNAFGENEPFYAGISFGYVMSGVDDSHGEANFRQPVGVDFDDTMSFIVHGGMILNEFVTLEGLMGYVFPFEDDGEHRSNDINVIMAGVNCKGRYPFLSPIQPYMSLGLGVFNTQENYQYGLESSTLTEWGLNYRIGLGMDIYITPYIFLGTELSHVSGMGKVDFITYQELSIGLYHRF